MSTAAGMKPPCSATWDSTDASNRGRTMLMRPSLPACLAFLILICGSPAAGADPPEKAASVLQGEPKLRVRLTVEQPFATLQEVLHSVSKETGVSLRAAP